MKAKIRQMNKDQAFCVSNFSVYCCGQPSQFCQEIMLSTFDACSLSALGEFGIESNPDCQLLLFFSFEARSYSIVQLVKSFHIEIVLKWSFPACLPSTYTSGKILNPFLSVVAVCWPVFCGPLDHGTHGP